MKWNRKADNFTLTRDELANLVLFNVAWKHEPKKKRPYGFEKFFKEVIMPADREMLKYLKFVKFKA